MAEQIISLDTDVMGAMAASVNAADQELESCVAKLALVIEHDDWNCRERDDINESIRQLRQSARRIKESMELFSHTVRMAAEALENLSRELPAESRQLQVGMGGFCSIPSGGSGPVNALSSKTAGQIAGAVRTQDPLANYSVANLTGDIQICGFDAFMPR